MVITSAKGPIKKCFALLFYRVLFFLVCVAVSITLPNNFLPSIYTLFKIHDQSKCLPSAFLAGGEGICALFQKNNTRRMSSISP